MQEEFLAGLGCREDVSLEGAQRKADILAEDPSAVERASDYVALPHHSVQL